MTLTLRLRITPPAPIDVESLTLGQLRSLSADEIQRLPLRMGRELGEVGTWFDVSGRADNTLCFQGDCRSIDGIGTAWAGGELIVEGSAGDRVGRRMSAGTLRVRGSVGALAASGMRGGRLEIEGDAGESLAGPLRGERTGMRGGRVVVHGNSAATTGHRMRRGTLIIRGHVGPRCGWEMVAGTIVAATIDPTDLAFAMRRGTILILNAAASTASADSMAYPVRPPCFSLPTPAPSGFLRLLLDDLENDCELAAPGAAGANLDRCRQGIGWQRRVGDLSRGGLGELIW